MIKAHRAVLGLLGGLFCSLSVFSAEQAGMVKVSQGQVTIERDGARIPAPVGAPVHVADRIRTGADGSVGITLRDNTRLSAGPKSLLVIDQFAFDGSTQAGKVSVGIRKGTLAVASGRIAKKTPESVDFHTPTSVLGVRGTEFVIEVADGNDE